MPPRRHVKEPAVPSKKAPDIDPWLPVAFPKSAKIEIQSRNRKLIVTNSKVSGTDAYHATLTYPGGKDESCIALCKRPSDAREAFEVLKCCSSRNIANPIGVWEDPANSIAYIVFPSIDGALKSIDRMMIFELEDNPASPSADSSASPSASPSAGPSPNPSASPSAGPSSSPSESPSAVCFTDQGCMILVDLVMAVKSVNDMQLPMKPLKLQKGSIFYQLMHEGQFHVLLSDFEDPGKYHGGKERNRRRTGSSTEQDMETINWNGLGKFLKELSGNIKKGSELEHLVDFLGKASVRYDDLVWEPAMWMLRTKLQLIREVSWCCDKDPTKKVALRKRGALGLKSCIDKLAISRDPELKEFGDTNLYDSVFFLRVSLVAHFDDTIKDCDKKMVEQVKDQRNLVRFLMQERPDYMVKFIREIRLLGWIKKSPLLREGNRYMEEFCP